MATDAIPTPRPFGIGRLSVPLILAVGGLLAAVVAGAYAYSLQATQGEAVTSLRDIGLQGGAAWGLYIIFDMYFVGLAFTGLALAAFTRVLHLEHLRPVARMALALTVVALIMSALLVVADLGRPLRGIANLLLYARPGSPFFGTFSLVIVAELVAALVFLYLAGRPDAARLAQRPGGLQGLYRAWAAGYQNTPAERQRRRVISATLAWVIIPFIIVAFSTLGLVLGLQPGRPGWFSALEAPGMVVLGGASGIGALIAIAALARARLGLRDRLPLRTFAWLGNVMLGLTLVALYLIVVEIMVGVYAPSARESQVADQILRGPYAWMFWLAVGLLAVATLATLLQLITRTYSVMILVGAGLAVNLATVLKRYVTVLPSQTHGAILPYDTGSYAPNWIEILVVAGIAALGTLLFLAFFKIFPILEIESTPGGGES